MRLNGFFKIGIVVLIVAVIGVSWFFINKHSSSKNQARTVAEDYMDAVENGDDLSDYIGYEIDGFIDVFDYEYLKEIEDIEKEKDIMEFKYTDFKKTDEYIDDADWKEVRGNFKRYEEYKEHYKEEYSDYDVTEDSSYQLGLWGGEYIDKHKFLYNVEVANGMGQKIHKKAEITVEDENKNGLVITDIYLR